MKTNCKNVLIYEIALLYNLIFYFTDLKPIFKNKYFNYEIL